MSDQPPFDPQQQPPYQPVNGNPPPPPYGQPGYPPPPYGQTPYGQPYGAQPGVGLSDNVAGAIAYITIIPAIVFLVIEPYRSRPFVRFHAMQCLGLALAGVVLQFFHIIPILGTIVAILGGLLIIVFWIIAIISAASGKMWRVPIIGKIAAEQAARM